HDQETSSSTRRVGSTARAEPVATPLLVTLSVAGNGLPAPMAGGTARVNFRSVATASPHPVGEDAVGQKSQASPAPSASASGWAAADTVGGAKMTGQRSTSLA